ncbi:MAG: hypothetical protein IJ999_01755 [Clostridia bacterium]|nr:hypothetical protein [Clostridia bacterium]
MDYQKVIRYFTVDQKSLKPWVILLLLSFVAIYVGVTYTQVALMIGALMAISALCVIIGRIKGRVKDSYIDEVIASKIKDIKQKAMTKFGIDQDEVNEIDPISFDGFIWEGEGVVAKKGKDGIYRSNKYEIALLLFSRHEVYAYIYSFYITKANEVEKTTLYFYKDILTVSTSTKEITLSDDSVIRYESFELDTAGKTLSCQLKNNDTAQRSINGLRSLIKAKKIN